LARVARATPNRLRAELSHFTQLSALRRTQRSLTASYEPSQATKKMKAAVGAAVAAAIKGLKWEALAIWTKLIVVPYFAK
jgi:hypothetical protein